MFEDIIKEQFEKIQEIQKDAYMAGYSAGFKSGKESDLKKEMAERDEPKEQVYPKGTYYYKEQIDNNFKKELRDVVEDLGVKSIGNSLKKVLSETELKELLSCLTK